jgi:hypothetical protein
MSCAGTDEILRRKFLNHQGDAYSLVQELSLDYNKKSNDNAIVARKKMYDLKYSPTTTNEEFINMLEEAAVAIENAGGDGANHSESSSYIRKIPNEGHIVHVNKRRNWFYSNLGASQGKVARIRSIH